MIVSVFLVLALASLGTARLNGVDEERAKEAGGTLATGCACHSPDWSQNVRAVLEGVPANYAIDGDVVAYNLTVRIEGDLVSDKGGFNLHVSDGILTAPEGDASVQVTDLGDATHVANELRTNWTVIWTEPAEPGEAVLFRVTVNSVNGNGFNDPQDQWARDWAVSAAEPDVALGAAADPLHVESLGVNWLAYWVGIVSFAFMIVVLILYYFVFRYAETSHATDHRDRKKK